jgi:hypothetical protein
MAAGTKNVYTQLLAAQKEMGPLLKNATNPHFRNKYADLSAVIETMSEPLHNNGLVVYQTIDIADGMPVLVTELVYAETGDKLRSCAPIACKDPSNPQALGAAITYIRRYSLMSLCGLAPEDDDGTLAAAPSQERRQTPPVNLTERVQQTRASASADAGTIEERQLKAIFAISRAIGMSSDEAREIIHDRYSVESSKQMSSAQADEFIAHLRSIENEQKRAQAGFDDMDATIDRAAQYRS